MHTQITCTFVHMNVHTQYPNFTTVHMCASHTHEHMHTSTDHTHIHTPHTCMYSLSHAETHTHLHTDAYRYTVTTHLCNHTQTHTHTRSTYINAHTLTNTCTHAHAHASQQHPSGAGTEGRLTSPSGGPSPTRPREGPAWRPWPCGTKPTRRVELGAR